MVNTNKAGYFLGVLRGICVPGIPLGSPAVRVEVQTMPRCLIRSTVLVGQPTRRTSTFRRFFLAILTLKKTTNVGKSPPKIGTWSPKTWSCILLILVLGEWKIHISYCWWFRNPASYLANNPMIYKTFIYLKRLAGLPNHQDTWRILPVSKWLMTMISK